MIVGKRALVVSTSSGFSRGLSSANRVWKSGSPALSGRRGRRSLGDRLGLLYFEKLGDVRIESVLRWCFFSLVHWVLLEATGIEPTTS